MAENACFRGFRDQQAFGSASGPTLTAAASYAARW